MPTEVTEYLEKSKSGDRDANDKIVQHFWDVARRTAIKKWSAQSVGHVSGSDVANSALRSALSEVQKPNSKIINRDDFLGLVILIAKRKAISELRRKTAKKRKGRHVSIHAVDDEGISGGIPEVRELPSPDLTPQQLKIAEELANWIDRRLKRECDPVKQMIGILAVLSQYSGPKILKALESEFPEATPDLRTVQVCAKEWKERLAYELRSDYAEYFEGMQNEKRKADDSSHLKKNTPAIESSKKKPGTKQSRKKGAK